MLRLCRTIIAVVAALSLIATTTVAAAAWTGEVEGPVAESHVDTTGYYIGHDANGFHLRTHGPKDSHRFTFRLRTDGVFVDVDGVRLESGDGFAVLDGGHTIVARFHTYEGIDGLNFRVRDGSALRFNLQLDGEPIATDQIFLGPDGTHPDSNPFTIHR